MKPVVLLTRPRRDSEPLAEAFERDGWRPLIWPLLEIEPTGIAAQVDGAQAVLLTSANAARLCPPAAAPAFCVGDATAEAASEAGFADVRSAGGDAEALARLVAAELSPADGPLVFPRGEAVAGDLARSLRARGFGVRELVVYRALAAREAPAEVAEALRGGLVSVATFYSPRTSEIFGRFAPIFAPGLARTRAAAISAKAARPLLGAGFAEVRVAATPDGHALLATVEAMRAASV